MITNDFLKKHLSKEQQEAIAKIEEMKEKMKDDIGCDADGEDLDHEACQYYGQLCEAIELIKKGGNIDEIMGDI